MKTLDDYIKDLKTDDVIKSAHKAKEESYLLMNDQGITAISLILSDTLADIIRNPQKILDKKR
jgi:hypothetical protein